MHHDSTLVESDETDITVKEIHPLIQLGVVAVGTKIGATLILRLAKYPALLFGMGALTGFYLNKNRKDIIEAARQIKDQGLKAAIKKEGDSSK